MTRCTAKRPTWLHELGRLFRCPSASGLTVLDLFCGAGGLSLGFWAHGFEVTGVDHDGDAAKTYTRNLGRAIEAEVGVDLSLPAADVIVAGPPCQPWSRAGHRRGQRDERDGLTAVAQSVERLAPSVVVVENVPDLARRHNREHLDSFEAALSRLGYAVDEHVLNAADYGVPQKRRRIFITGVRDGQPIGKPDSWARTITVREAIPGTYRRDARGARIVSASMSAYITRYENASGCRTPRDLDPDRPSRTLTVRNLVGATGDMMRLRLPDGRRRTLTVREAARLQSFPDWFRFAGSTQSQLTQIGNAVPPLLSLAVADTVYRHLKRTDESALVVD